MIKIGNLEIEKILIGNSDVSKVYVGNTVVYSPSSGSPTPPTPVPMEEQYLTIEAVEGDVGSLRLNTFEGEAINGLEYNVNDTGWTSLNLSPGHESAFYLNVGDYIRFRYSPTHTGEDLCEDWENLGYMDYEDCRCQEYGECGSVRVRNLALHIWSDANPQSWQTPKKYVVYGNLYSLLDKDPEVFSQIDDLTEYDVNFRGLFGDRDGEGYLDLISASGLCLNATTLCDNAYDEMFRGCQNLLYAPTLPAPWTVEYSYSYMFCDCSSLCYIKCLAWGFQGWGTNNWIGNGNEDGGLGIASAGTFVLSSIADPDYWGDGNGAYSFPQSGWTILNESGQTVQFNFNCDMYVQGGFEDNGDCRCQMYDECDPGVDCEDCDGDPECECICAGGSWGGVICDCNGDPECECITQGGFWDGENCNVNCDNYENYGYGSWEECSCAEYGAECPEEEGDGGEEEPEEPEE